MTRLCWEELPGSLRVSGPSGAPSSQQSRTAGAWGGTCFEAGLWLLGVFSEAEYVLLPPQEGSWQCSVTQPRLTASSCSPQP